MKVRTAAYLIALAIVATWLTLCVHGCGVGSRWIQWREQMQERREERRDSNDKQDKRRPWRDRFGPYPFRHHRLES